DIDWEYPGYAPHSGTAADKVNFTLLLQNIRDSLNALGTLKNAYYKLSACFSADPALMQNIQWSNVVPLLDMINLMSYDFFGAWDCVANHNSPLYSTP
ncbi:MAG TPA: glycosyl hydrolase family 18 protein, partial [Bacteroidia bacterium]|nr:glycosyl hydrolase family 18 protein [Bacteroidia bacterium]